MYAVVTQVLGEVVVNNLPTREAAEAAMARYHGYLMVVPSADVPALQASRRAEMDAVLSRN